MVTIQTIQTSEFIQQWFTYTGNSFREECNWCFFQNFSLEKYVLKLYPNERDVQAKLRCSN